jgi:hypothetical protein
LLAILMLMVFKPGAHRPEASGAPPDGSSSHPPRVRARQAAAAHIDEHADGSVVAVRIGDRDDVVPASSPDDGAPDVMACGRSGVRPRCRALDERNAEVFGSA